MAVPSNRRGRLQTLPAASVPPPPERVVLPPPVGSSSEAPPPAPVPPPLPVAPGSVDKDSFYGRMLSGEVAEAPATPEPSSRRRALVGVAGAAAAVLVLAGGWFVAVRPPEPEVVLTPVALSIEETARLADIWVAFGAPGPVRDDVVGLTVATVGAGVAGPMAPQLGRRQARFRVINHPALRATPLPDGTVVISTGLLRQLQNDAELAAVLGHALAHVALGHVVVKAPSDEEADKIKSALTGASPVRAVDAIAEAVLAFTPEQERAADALMVQGLKGAQRSTRAAVEGLLRLQLAPDERGAWKSVHPIDPLRRQQLEAVSPGGSLDEGAFRAGVLIPLRQERQ